MPNSRESAFAIARLLSEHNGGDVIVLDMAVQAGWTDWFVIATATSGVHLKGLSRFVDEYLWSSKTERLNTRRDADEEEWILIDLGNVVVHLMTASARSFYELEKLWFQSESTRIEASAPKARE